METGNVDGRFKYNESGDVISILSVKAAPAAFESMAKYIKNVLCLGENGGCVGVSGVTFVDVSRTSKRIDMMGLHNTRRANLAFLKGEVVEFEDAVRCHDKANMEEEIGDILFDTVMLAESHGINAEIALNKTVEKLNERMNLMEKISGDDNFLIPRSKEETYALWQQAKKLQK